MAKDTIEILIDADVKNAEKAIKDLQKTIADVEKDHAKASKESQKEIDALTKKVEKLSATEKRASTSRQSSDSKRDASNKKRISQYVQMERSIKSLAVSAQRLAIIYLSYRIPQEFIKNLVDIEKGLIAIDKTTGMTVEEFKELEKSIMELSTTMAGISTDQILKIAEAAGQLGLRGVENITEFTEVVAMMAVTTDLSAEEAAKAMARLGTILGEPIDKIENMASAINELSNTTTATAGEIVDISQRMAGMAEMFGLATDEVFAFAATLKDVGISVEVAGTAMSQLMSRMLDTSLWEEFANIMGITIDEFAVMIGEDATGAMVKFLEELGKLDKISSSSAMKDLNIDGERLRNTVLKLSQNTEVLTKNMLTSQDAMAKGTSISDEYAKVAKGLGSQFELLTNNVKDAAMKIGKELMPAIQEITSDMIQWFKSLDSKAIADTAKDIGQLVSDLKPLTVALVKAAGAALIFVKSFSLISKTIAAGVAVLAGAKSVFWVFMLAIRSGTGIVTAAAIAFKTLGNAMKINPAILALTAVYGALTWQTEKLAQATDKNNKSFAEHNKTQKTTIGLLQTYNKSLDEQGRSTFKTAEAMEKYKVSLDAQVTAIEKKIEALKKEEDGAKKNAVQIDSLARQLEQLKDVQDSVIATSGKMSAAWHKERMETEAASRAASEAARKRAGETKKYTDEQLKNIKTLSNTRIKDAIKTNTTLEAQAKKLANSIKKLNEELARELQAITNSRVSSASDAESQIRDINRQGMTEKEQYYDKQRESEEKLAEARKQLELGNLELYKKYVAEAKALATENAGHAIEQEGKIVVSKEETARRAIAMINKTQKVESEAYDKMEAKARAKFETEIKFQEAQLKAVQATINLNKQLITQLSKMIELLTGNKVDMDFKEVEQTEESIKEALLSLSKLKEPVKAKVTAEVDQSQVEKLETKTKEIEAKETVAKIVPDAEGFHSKYENMMAVYDEEDAHKVNIMPDEEKFKGAFSEVVENLNAETTVTPDKEEFQKEYDGMVMEITNDPVVTPLDLDTTEADKKAIGFITVTEATPAIVKLDGDTVPLSNDYDKIKKKIESTPIYVPLKIAPMPAGAGAGAAPLGYADGGKIQGHDLSGSDNVPIMATQGEFMFPTDVVDALGVDKLYATIKAVRGGAKGYANGGVIESGNTSNSSVSNVSSADNRTIYIDAKRVSGDKDLESAINRIIQRGL